MLPHNVLKVLPGVSGKKQLSGQTQKRQIPLAALLAGLSRSFALPGDHYFQVLASEGLLAFSRVALASSFEPYGAA